MKKRKVLLLSSRPPSHSAGYVHDTISTIEFAGCQVDLLTLYNFDNQKPNQYNLFKKPLSLLMQEVRNKYNWLRYLRFLYHMPLSWLYRKTHNDASKRCGDILMVFEDETKPPVDPNVIIDKISGDYDYYFMMIPQDMFTSITIEKIYERYQKPIIIHCPDMYYFTGNCFFPNDCREFVNECRECPAFENSANINQAHKNFLYKKQVYNKIRCVFECNTHEKLFFQKTFMIPSERILTKCFTLDVNEFKPLDVDFCRKEFGVPQKKSFIILVRYISPQGLDWNRKGGKYLVESLNILYDNLTIEERKTCLIMFIGVTQNECMINTEFDSLCIGIVNRVGLIKAFNASSVFLCPSIDDAGPSMVNQSMACSTPVVAFNQGTAIDVLENGISGFKTNLYNSKGLAEGLHNIIKMNSFTYKLLRETTRETALKYNSFEAGAKYYNELFEKFENGKF